MTRTTRLNTITKMVALLAFGSAACSTSAAETPYPTRPVRFVVGFPPGGGVDAMARLLSPKLSDAMGQNWIVDARSGAGGNLGAEIVARSNPDGYTTLLALSTQLTVNPGLYKMPFSVEKDLQPVTMVVKAEHILVVHPSVPARTLNEFIALARQKPGTLNFPSAGVGSSIHMAGELLKKRVGIDMVHVAYKGAGPAIASMLAGETQVLTGTVVSALTHLNTGKLRALASLGARRSKVLPDLPTVAESGYPGFEADAWYGVLVPSGTPKSIVERIRSEVLTALQYPDVRTAMSRLGLDPETSTPADLAARIKAETSMYAVLIKEAGIRAE